MNNVLTVHTFRPPPSVVYGGMKPRTPIDPIPGKALRRLRLISGKKLKEIEPDVGVTQQAMSRWETAQIVFPLDKIPVYLKAIGRTEADLAREVRTLREEGQGGVQAIVSHAPPNSVDGLEAFQVRDESMTPWCEPGEVVLFQRGNHPRRLDGCLVEMVDGARIVRLFQRQDGGKIVLQRFNPAGFEEYAADKIAAIHRISYRGG